RSAQNEGNFSGVVGGLSLGGQSGRVVEPIRGILFRAATPGGFYAWRYLIPAGFVRRGLQHPAQAVGDSQTGGNPPSVLAIELVIVDGVAALDGRALGQGAAVARKVVDTVSLGKDTHDNGGRAVIVRAEVAVHRRITVIGRIQRTGCAGDSTRVEIDRIRPHIGERVRVAGMVVTDQEEIAAELKGMVLPRPVQGVGELMEGHKENRGSSERDNAVDSVQ